MAEAVEVSTEEAGVVALTEAAIPGLVIGPAPTRPAATTISRGETPATSATRNDKTVAEMLEVAVVKVATEDSEIAAVDSEEIVVEAMAAIAEETAVGIVVEAMAVIAEETAVRTVMVVVVMEVVPCAAVEEAVEAIVSDPIKNRTTI